MKYTKGIIIPASIPESYESICAMAGLLTYSPRPGLPTPIKIGTVTKRMGFGIWSLQLRDSPGFTPASLLIPVFTGNQKQCKLKRKITGCEMSLNMY